MVITPAMVSYVLNRRGIGARVVGSHTCPVERIRAWRSKQHEDNTLYITDALDRATPSDADSYAILVMEGVEALPHGDKHPLHSASELVERASDAFHELALWEIELKDALLRHATLDEFMAIGSRMLSCPLAYIDRNLITLAASEGYWYRNREMPGGHPGLHVSNQMPSNLAVDLVEDFDYLDAAEKHEPFYYTSAQQRTFYGVNTFDEGTYLARLVFALPDGTTRLHVGEEQLIAHYHRYLDDLYLHYAGNVDVVSSQNDALHALVRTALIEDDPRMPDEAESILASFGWNASDAYIAVKIVFFEGVHWDSISLYLCGLLELAMAHSCAFPLGKQIIWLVNLTRCAKGDEDQDKQVGKLVESLVAIMRDYACKAGISGEFSSFFQSRWHYLEAEQALEIGQARDPHYWYYRFGDYAFDFMLAQCTKTLPGDLLCHPALSTLIAYDAAHATEYTRTLVCFLRNSQNTTHAADELFIHRTSFMRRMAQIQKLTQIDLENPDEVLHLLLSAKLVGM